MVNVADVEKESFAGFGSTNDELLGATVDVRLKVWLPDCVQVTDQLTEVKTLVFIGRVSPGTILVVDVVAEQSAGRVRTRVTSPVTLAIGPRFLTLVEPPIEKAAPALADEGCRIDAVVTLKSVVGAGVGVGVSVGAVVGVGVGLSVGADVGVGLGVGVAVAGSTVGVGVGESVGAAVGALVGVGDAVKVGP